MHRNITYRLIPGTRAKAQKLSQIAGACRWVWNYFLGENKRRYREHVETERFCEDTLLGLMFEQPAKPPLTFFELGKQFTILRSQTGWLQELPFTVVRYTLKRQADAWQRAFAGGGFPKFKARDGNDSFTLPQDVRIRGGKLWIPRVGWLVLRRRGGNPYGGCKPVQAVVKRVLGRWYCTVCYAVPHSTQAHNGIVVGVDRNCGHVAVSDGRIFAHPDIQRLEARKRRYERMMCRREKGSKRRAVARYRLAKTHRKIATIRANWQHHVSCELADTAGTVVVEALRTKNMTLSAKGTADKPGVGVARKAALNRAILATGWAGLHAKLSYKAAEVIEVAPAYTSQRCNACGHTEAANRRSQSEFHCVVCGHAGNADINAALNVLALGTEAAGRRGAFSLETPKNRQETYPQGLAYAGLGM
ncbi:MAG: transposase [Gammaproteobacteria bacterium]|nr:transposase [Gammaproteobacteria bacterium]MYF66460.1 transposase [Gammaproteobacteria bacterium]MYK37222.1 transposase [Gammaproteobacteria bacterium]